MNKMKAGGLVTIFVNGKKVLTKKNTIQDDYRWWLANRLISDDGDGGVTGDNSKYMGNSFYTTGGPSNYVLIAAADNKDGIIMSNDLALSAHYAIDTVLTSTIDNHPKFTATFTSDATSAAIIFNSLVLGIDFGGLALNNGFAGGVPWGLLDITTDPITTSAGDIVTITWELFFTGT